MIDKLRVWASAHQVEVALGLCSITILMGLVYWAPWPKHSSDYAAWVQAVGAIAAILVALVLAAKQAADAKAQRREEYRRARRDRIDGVAALMTDIYWQLKLAMDAAEEPSPSRWMIYMVIEYQPSRLQRAVDALADAPVHELGNWRLVQAAIEMREIGHEAIDWFDGERTRLNNTEEGSPKQATYLFNAANRRMEPIVRALAHDEFLASPLSEWKEHLD